MHSTTKGTARKKMSFLTIEVVISCLGNVSSAQPEEGEANSPNVFLNKPQKN